MIDHAVIAGTFADFKLIKTRSTAQLVIELAIEHADEALRVLGGVPQPGKEIPVAVARMTAHREPKAKRTSLTQQAGIRCGERTFQTYLEETHPHIAPLVPGEMEAAEAVRQICGVDSRAEFDSDAAAGQRWRALETAFQGWKML
jgi:anti-sigma-K factor RskA